MTSARCEHEWTDRSANRSAEWLCAKCQLSFTEVKPSTATKRPWVGLTDEEIDALEPATDTLEFPQTVRAIEAKLKEKNT